MIKKPLKNTVVLMMNWQGKTIIRGFKPYMNSPEAVKKMFETLAKFGLRCYQYYQSVDCPYK